MPAADRVLRAMTNDGAFRIVATRTTDTVSGVIAAQAPTSLEEARLLGALVTGSVLYRETMSPSKRVQCVVRGADGSGQLVADSNPDGTCRAMLMHGRGAKHVRLVGEGALLQMMRPLRSGELHTGTVTVPESGSLDGAFMNYYEQSEQTTTMISTSTVVDMVDGSPRVVAAGGYLVQLLPEVREAEGALAIMTARLEDFVDLDARMRDHDASPDHLIEEIFFRMEHTMLGDSPVRFACSCSRERVMASLATLCARDLTELVEGGEPLETRCDYCGSVYVIEPELLRGMLSAS